MVETMANAHAGGASPDRTRLRKCIGVAIQAARADFGEGSGDVGRQQRTAIEHRRAVDERQHDRALEPEHVLRRHAADEVIDAVEAAFDLPGEPGAQEQRTGRQVQQRLRLRLRVAGGARGVQQDGDRVPCGLPCEIARARRAQASTRADR